MKASIKQKYKTKSVISDTPKWAARKALSNTYIAASVQHMRSTENLDNRCYFITAHNETRPDKNKVLPSHRAICTNIYKAVSRLLSTSQLGNKIDISHQDKPGMIFCSDVFGTRSDANRGNFDFTDSPHIHAILFLPFEISDARTDVAFMHNLMEIIRDVDGIKKYNIGTNADTVLVEKFVPNKPMWWLVDYAIKAQRFTAAHQKFQPLVFPYHYKLEKYEPSNAKTDLQLERFARKRNTILAGQERASINLTYDPRKFYKSDMCCDFSVSHKALLACNKMTKPENHIPTEREINEIISWRGKFDGSQCGNLPLISTANTDKPNTFFDAVQPTEWGISLSGYIDESACRVALGKAVNPASLTQQTLMPTDFWQSPSEHAWLKTQDYFHQRLMYWRLHFRLFALARFCSIYRIP
ncbi:hypothetical protein [Phaeobacter gallaeciensis]|uniref:hypothetical protein n=1 Tax=Phaeobacter gallaeciensis TaxID=60890 RepID=UPI00237FD438|nr:hypothetical protein [Phaeobacter gallaeciensis]MDE4062179.1 hypothetical protein [Phaeobacter gallaeciensis]MDE4125669.1 hypothetical protein [Phaeobacter gallaeciensis]MDE4129672.1 hypothetical protein [Phaeobacter gallaeciensis]